MQLKSYFVVAALFFSSLCVQGEEVPELAAIPTPAPESVTNLTITKSFADTKKSPEVIKFRRPHFFRLDTEKCSVADNGKIRVFLDHKNKTAFTSDSFGEFHKLDKENLFIDSFNAVTDLKKHKTYPAPELNVAGFVFNKSKSKYGKWDVLHKISGETGLLAEILHKEGNNPFAKSRLTYEYPEIPQSDFDLEIPKDYQRRPHIYFKPENANKIVERLNGVTVKKEANSISKYEINFNQSRLDYYSTKLRYPHCSLFKTQHRSVFDDGKSQTVLYHSKKVFFTAPSFNKANKQLSNENMAESYSCRIFKTPDPNARTIPPQSPRLETHDKLRFLYTDGQARYSKGLSIYDTETGIVLVRISANFWNADNLAYIRIISASLETLPDREFVADIPAEYKQTETPHISGTVFDAAAKPVADCDVWADRGKIMLFRRMADSVIPPAFYHTRTDKEGKFFLSLPVTPSKYSPNNITIKAFSEKHPDLIAWNIVRIDHKYDRPNKDIIPHNGNIIQDDKKRILSAEDLHLVLQPSFSISGKVTDYDKSPVKGVKIKLKARVTGGTNYLSNLCDHILIGPDEMSTDENGYYCFSRLPGLTSSKYADYKLESDDSRYSTLEENIDCDKKTTSYKKDFTVFKKGAEIVVRAVDKTGKPVPGLQISAYPVPVDNRRGFGIRIPAGQKTDKNGEYRLKDCEICEKYHVSCSNNYHDHCLEFGDVFSADKKSFKGYKSEHKEIDTSTGEKEYVAKFIMEENDIILHVIVKDVNGNPLPDCQVQFIPGMYGQHSEASILPFCELTNENGLIDFKYIPDGHYHHIKVSPVPEARLFAPELHKRIKKAADDATRKLMPVAQEKIDFNSKSKEYTAEITIGITKNSKSFLRMLNEDTDPDVF